MREVLRLIIAPVSSLIIIMLGTSFFNTFVSIHLAQGPYGRVLAGVAYAAFFAGIMTGAFRMENLIRYIGHIRAFAIFAAVTSASILLQSFTEQPFYWILMRFFSGLACAGLFIVIESWLLLLSSPGSRGVILSIYMISLYGAQSLGQFILNTLDLNSFTPFNLTVIFSSLSIIPVCLMRANAPTITDSEHVSILYLLKKTPFGFCGNFVAGLILSAFYALGPVFAKESNFTVFQVSQVMGVTIFGGLALQWPIGLLSDVIERRSVIIGVSAIITLISFALFICSHMIHFYALLLILFLFGGFSFTLYPLSITYCCDFFSSAGITAVTCTALIIYGVGCIIGPLVAPLVMKITIPAGLFLYAGIMSLALTIYGIWRTIHHAPQPKANQESYLPLPNITPKIANLDPRGEEEETTAEED